MQNRYWLRFESGERQGESVPITDGGFVVGRKPGSSLQILDASVSGRHAEFVFDAEGLLLKDLGSTNGTRIGNQRVLEERCAHGDVITFGNVRVALTDSQFVSGAAQKTAAGPPADEGRAGEDVGRLSADKVAAASGGKRSLIGVIVVTLLLGALGGVWYWSGQGGEGGERETRPVVEVSGNLIEGYSFEGDVDGWIAHESGSAEFSRAPSAAYSGELGLSANVAGGEWALSRSEDLTVSSGRKLTLRGAIEAIDGAEGRIGVEFLSEDVEEGPAGPTSFFAWSAPRKDTGGFDEVELVATVPDGYTRARAAVFCNGDGEGRVDIDDVSLVMDVGGLDPQASVEEFDLFLHGEQTQSGTLYKVDRLLLSRLELRSAEDAVATEGDASGIDGRGIALTAALASNGIEITPSSGAGRGAVLSCSVEPDAAENGIATIGEVGYRLHAADFDREGVSSLLIGVQKDLVRFKFDAPVHVVGRPNGAVVDISLTLSDASPFLVQLGFLEEKTEAGNLAYEAEKAEDENRLGDCLASWERLLDNFPYESKLVTKAETARARLVLQGLTEVRTVSEELERARFFRLVDLYRKCREDARTIGACYVGSAVDDAAKEVIVQVDSEVAGLEADIQGYERGRLQGIHRVLVGTGATGLASEVEKYLDENFQGGD